MEWLVLVLLVPAILIPVVLLWGFAGCKFDPIRVPFAPTDLSATGVSVSAIALTWNNPNTDAVTFQVQRTKEGEDTPTTLATSSRTLQDSGLEEATTYSYTVRAFAISDDVASDPSEPAQGRTIGVAFETSLTTDEPGREGFTVVQRIEPARLRHSTLAGDILTPGARLRITVRGSTVASLTIDRTYISQPAAAGDPYDSAADLTVVDSGVQVPANTAVALPLVDYDLDRTRPLLIAFDISSSPVLGNLRFVTGVPATDAVAYLSPATIQASINDRSPSAADPGGTPYVPSPSVYLVEKIEVV